MKIGVDGAALDQGLFAGIYNVTASLFTTMARLRPQSDFVLTFEKNATDAARRLCSRNNTSWRSKRFIQRSQIGNDGASVFGLETTDDPNLVILLDGYRKVLPVEKDKYRLVFVIEKPCRSMVVLSRSVRPADISGSIDQRSLGVPLKSITITGPLQCQTLIHSDPDLSSGFHGAEALFNWTDGSARVPSSLFQDAGWPLTVAIDLAPVSLTYFKADPPVVDTARTCFQYLGALAAHAEERLFKQSLTDIDIYHSHHFAPRIVDGAINVATAYDIIPLLHPHFFGDDAVAHFQEVLSVFRRCDRVFCISEATRRDLIDRVGLSPQQVVTAHIDCDAAFQVLPDGSGSEILKAHRLDGERYVICVGTIEPRKGHRRLVEIFNRYRAKNPKSDLKLLIVGKKGWGFETVFADIERSDFKEDILYLSGIETSELVYLYNGALFGIYISEYEGFGLPILEALACGRPVLASDCSSMPEVVGDAGLVAAPGNLDEILSCFTRICEDADLRRKLSENAIAQRAKFSWETCAGIYLENIEDLFEQRSRKR